MAMDVTSCIAQYIGENNIEIEEVVEATHIKREKLTLNQEKLTAGELLELCAYLGVRPEDFYEKKLK